MKIKIVKINYAYDIFFDKFLGLICSGIPFIASKHGGLQQIVARLMLATLSLFYVQGRENQTFLCYRSLVDILT